MMDALVLAYGFLFGASTLISWLAEEDSLAQRIALYVALPSCLIFLFNVFFWSQARGVDQAVNYGGFIVVAWAVVMAIRAHRFMQEAEKQRFVDNHRLDSR